MFKKTNEESIFRDKMFKKINILTHASSIGIVSVLIINFYNNKDATDTAEANIALVGLVIMAWFIIVFCSHRKSHKKKDANAQE
ncbi:MAG: hypothetical protein WA063_03605 [Minisyncoccia bacterium]